MPNEVEEVAVVDQEAPPEDYKEYLAWQANQADAQAEPPAAGEAAEPLSESSEAEVAAEGQTAVESDLTEQQEQEEQEEEQEQEAEPKDRRLSRRIRKLTGTIASLETRLAALSESEAEGDGTEEVASSPETEAPPAAEATKRPLLRDFEDSDAASAWDQYEAAMDAFNQAQTQKAIADALTKQKQELDTAHAQQQAQADWNKAASRYPNYNEIVARDEVKISAAMESIMRLDPEKGTSLAYYLGQHPEESERIAKATLANTEKEWGTALARAGMELGALTSKLPAPPGKEAAKVEPSKADAKKPATAAAPAPKPQPAIKKVSTASKPPAQLRGQAVPKTDPASEDDASDYRKWNAAREAQLRNRK
jgi:hypothetical protein